MLEFSQDMRFNNTSAQSMCLIASASVIAYAIHTGRRVQYQRVSELHHCLALVSITQQILATAPHCAAADTDRSPGCCVPDATQEGTSVYSSSTPHAPALGVPGPSFPFTSGPPGSPTLVPLRLNEMKLRTWRLERPGELQW